MSTIPDLPVDLGTVGRKRGDTKPFKVTLTDEDGELIPLSGYSFFLTGNSIKSPPDVSTQLFQLIGSSPDDGEIVFPWLTADADQLGSVYFDVQLTGPAGVITTLLIGKFKFTQDITK